MIDKTIDQAMMELPQYWRHRWCNSSIESPCGCMGCVNGSGQIESKGFTKAQWEAWIADPANTDKILKPNQEQIEMVIKFQEYLDKLQLLK